MPSSRRLIGVAIALLASRRASAQPAPGFTVDRLDPSAPGAGWLVMDTLDMHGELGGALSLAIDYARNPLRVGDLAVVSNAAFADIGAAVTHDRWRAYLDLHAPIAVDGHSGTAGGAMFEAPGVDLSSNPDLMNDARLGVDVRFVGDSTSRFRMGAGVLVIVPNGKRSDYTTDDTFRAIGRVLVAGDTPTLAYAGHLGVHVRPLDDGSVPGGPRGSELLFGVAGGAKLAVDPCTIVVVGPEVHGAIASGSDATALEALISARVEGTAATGRQVRFKVGAGVGLEPHLGTPQWRLVVGIEVFNRDLRRR